MTLSTATKKLPITTKKLRLRQRTATKKGVLEKLEQEQQSAFTQNESGPECIQRVYHFGSQTSIIVLNRTVLAQVLFQLIQNYLYFNFKRFVSMSNYIYAGGQVSYIIIYPDTI